MCNLTTGMEWGGEHDKNYLCRTLYCSKVEHPIRLIYDNFKFSTIVKLLKLLTRHLAV